MAGPKCGFPPGREVTGYKVSPGFYTAPLHDAEHAYVEKLSPEVQKLITDVAWFEARSGLAVRKVLHSSKKENDFRASKGMKDINLEGAEAVRAARAAWAEVIERSPKHGPKLKALFTKQ